MSAVILTGPLQVRRGTKAQLDTIFLATGELGFTTDTKQVFVGGSSENILVGRALFDTEGSIPAPGVPGRIFMATDTHKIFVDTGSIWIDNTHVAPDYLDSSNRVQKLRNVSAGVDAEIDDLSNTTSDLWTAARVQAEIQAYLDGLSWQHSVISQALSDDPNTPSAGDRYIVGELAFAAITAVNAGLNKFIISGNHAAALTGGDKIRVRNQNNVTTSNYQNNGEYTVLTASDVLATTEIVVSETVPTSEASGFLAWSTTGSNWVQIASPGDIVEYNGSVWTIVTSGAGAPAPTWAVGITDEDTEYVFTINHEWVDKIASTTHNNLAGLQGGTTNQYYHLTSAQHTEVVNLLGVTDIANGFVKRNSANTGYEQVPYGSSGNTVTEGNDTRLPSQDENDALVGTDGLPSAANPYVTDSDPRNTDSRSPIGLATGDLGGAYPNPSVEGIQGTDIDTPPNNNDNKQYLLLRTDASTDTLTWVDSVDGGSFS